ncbi:hypothetical protein F4677DRAFT_462691 [Hypoxylon crocopeplum]|nr:hypothetical protein F4677DRAFT_462691 [Hypoxylon crocopeplum]
MGTSQHISGNSELGELQACEVHQYSPVSKSNILSYLDEWFGKIRGTVESLANTILQPSQPIRVQWNLQPVLVDAAGKLIKPHDCVVVMQERGLDCDRCLYAPVITIPLPTGTRPTDKRVAFIRDALLYDDTGKSQRHGIPFRLDPRYDEFALDFKADVSDNDMPGGSLWCPSTWVYLPDPDTISNQLGPRFIRHWVESAEHMANDLILRTEYTDMIKLVSPIKCTGAIRDLENK